MISVRSIFILSILLLGQLAIGGEELEDGLDLTLRDRDSQTALPSNPYLINSDWHRFSIALNLNANPFKMIDLTTLEVLYFRKVNGIWFHLLGGFTNSTFEQISENPTSFSGNGQAEVNNPRSAGSKVSLINVGMGISYRFRFLHSLFPSKPLTESCATAITYNRITDTLRSTSYVGPGIKIDYGVQYRTGRSFHYGLKMSYNIASGKRSPAFTNEPSTDRTMTLSWLTVGVDFTFYLQ